MEKRKKAPSVVGPVLVLAVLVLAGILVWAFAGDTVRGWFGGDKQPEDVDPGTTQNQPVNTPVDNEPVVKALALDHMSLLMAPGESEKLTATGGAEESYQWITSDSGVLKVSDDGTVSALTEGSARCHRHLRRGERGLRHHRAEKGGHHHQHPRQRNDHQ